MGLIYFPYFKVIAESLYCVLQEMILQGGLTDEEKQILNDFYTVIPDEEALAKKKESEDFIKNYRYYRHRQNVCGSKPKTKQTLSGSQTTIDSSQKCCLTDEEVFDRLTEDDENEYPNLLQVIGVLQKLEARSDDATLNKMFDCLEKYTSENVGKFKGNREELIADCRHILKRYRRSGPSPPPPYTAFPEASSAILSTPALGRNSERRTDTPGRNPSIPEKSGINDSVSITAPAISESKSGSEEGISTRNDSCVAEKKSQENNQFPNLRLPRYGDPLFGDQSDPIQGNTLLHFSKNVAIEVDTIHFSVIDKTFRNLILQRALEKKWDRKENNRQIIIRPSPSVPLTIQLGNNSINFYSKAPDDLTWIGQFLKENFGDYEKIEEIIEVVRRPKNITNYELTLIVMDPLFIQGIDLVMERYTHINGVLLFTSPCLQTPGFKIYCPREGVMRLEFTAHNNIQAAATIHMMQHLIEVVSDIEQISILLPLFLRTYYLGEVLKASGSGCPYCPPHKIPAQNDNESNEKKSDVKNKNEGINTRLLKIKHQSESFMVDYEKLEIFSLEDFGSRMKKIIDLAVKHFDLETETAAVLVAALAMWQQHHRRKAVLYEEIRRLLEERAGMELNLPRIKEGTEKLIASGLCEKSDKYDIRFSSAGRTLSKKMFIDII